MQQFVNRFGMIGALIFVLIQIVQVVFPIIPGGISCLAGVLLFGAVPGFFYNYIGICVGSCIAFGIARKTKKSVFCYSIPLLAGLAIGHAFVPPTPGPVLVAEMLNVELSYVIMLGIIIGIPAMILAGPVFGKFAGSRFNCPVPSSYLENEKEGQEKNKGRTPNFWVIVCIILLPLFLIILNTLSSIVPFMMPVQPILEFLGTPVIALLLSTICAMLFLGLPAGFSVKEITNIMTNSLHSCGNIILLISGGGMLRFILQNSGIGELFGNFVGALPLPMVLVAFLVAAVVRISVGSATVSMTMAAGIIASMPMVADLSQLQLATLTIAIASGGTAFSHVNDSGFWLSKSLFEVDEKTNFKTWTVMETIVGLVGIVGATIVWFVVS